MRNKIAAVPSFLFVAIATLLTFSACEPDPCEDAICAPCPSSRFVMQYEDSVGACLPAFHASAIVYAIDSLGDTLYNYNFSDS
ncbi:MAG: hypothetical protein AAF570_13970, partial [Bacteroidota bacterium]